MCCCHMYPARCAGLMNRAPSWLVTLTTQHSLSRVGGVGSCLTRFSSVPRNIDPAIAHRMNRAPAELFTRYSFLASVESPHQTRNLRSALNGLRNGLPRPARRTAARLVTLRAPRADESFVVA